LPDVTAAVLAAVIGIIWIIGLWYLGAYTPPAVLAWRRLARMRGLSVERSWTDRLGGRLPLLKRLQAETDIGRMLFIAGRKETASAWFLRTGFVAGGLCVVLLLLDELGLLVNGNLSYPVAVAVLVGVMWSVYAYIRLRNQAARRQRSLNRSITDSLVHLAAMTFHQRLPASEALLIFSRCQADGELLRVLNRPEARFTPQAAGTSPAEGTAAIYERLGDAYNVPMFHSLASGMRRVTERGLSSRDVFTQLARTTYGDLLAEAKVQSAQAKTLIVLPMGLMIFPLLVLIGAPLVASMASLFGP
jgi:Type II secretion system (T2SS), protein F